MSEDKVMQIREGKEINIENPQEVKEWSEFFGVEEGSLVAAVKFTGASSQKVQKFLGK